MNYVITTAEEGYYNETGEISERLKTYWKHFLGRLPVELQSEAMRKGFKLSLHPLEGGKASPGFSYNLIFDIPDASNELKAASEDFHHIIMCMRD